MKTALLSVNALNSLRPLRRMVERISSLFTRDFLFVIINAMSTQTKNNIVIALAAVIVIGGIIWMSRPSTPISVPRKEWSAGALIAPEQFFDFGTISMAAGKVRNSFAVRNDGSEPVSITKIITSCMCTVARLKTGERTFGPFGMPGHGIAPSIREEIAPGETAEIEIEFDPAAHGPSGTGAIRRIVSIETNSQTKPKLELSFAANVTP